MKKLAFFTVILLLGFLIGTSSAVEKYRIKWSPQNIDQTLDLGKSKDFSATFTSITKLNNVDLWVVPELQPFISVEPNHFQNVEANTPYEVTVHISVPIETEGIIYSGNIHLRVNSKTYPETLKVKLNVVNLMYGAVPPPDTIPGFRTIQYTTEDGNTFDMEAVSGHVIVQFDATVPWEIAEQLIISKGGAIIGKIPMIGYYLVNVYDEMGFINQIRLEPGVIYSLPDYKIGPRGIPNEWDNIPIGDSKRKVFDEIRAPEAWNFILGNINLFLLNLVHTKIGLVDIAFNGLPDGMNDFSYVSSGDRIDTGLLSIFGYNWPILHGTQTLSVCCAQGNNGFGNVGVNWWSPIGIGDLLADAVFYRNYKMVGLINRGSKVINLSVGPTGNQDLVCQNWERLMYEIDYRSLFSSIEKQINRNKSDFLVVVAAGNDPCQFNREDFNKPNNVIIASLKGPLVCSADLGSVKGSLVDIATPDGLKWYDYKEHNYGESLIGTSFAAPLVTGAAALVWAVEPSLQPEQVVQRLKDTSNKCADNQGIRDFGGAGILDVYKALVPTPPPPSPPIIFNIDPINVAKCQEVTFTLTGSGFQPGFAAYLINEQGVTYNIPPEQTQYVSPEMIRVTVYLGEGPTSMQTIFIVNPDGQWADIVFQALECSPTCHFTFTTINFPFAHPPYLLWINDSGTIVGSYVDATERQHGFLYSGGTFTTIDVPGASDTEVQGINNSGNIVGNYVDGTRNHGFLYSGGTFTTIDVPGAFYTWVVGVNNSGTILGIYSDGTVYCGFLYAGGSFSTIVIDVPGASGTSPAAFNNSGAIVGHYYDAMWKAHGFLYSGGTFTTVDVPGASVTFAQGINDSGAIVGHYYDAMWKAHGFLYSGGTFTTVDVPGAFFTIPFAINNSGTIVGIYRDATGTLAFFIATPNLSP